MNPNASIEFLQNLQANITNGNIPPSTVNNLLNQFAANNNGIPTNNNNMNPAPMAPPPNQINLIQNKPETVISNRTYSVIIEYWFRTTNPSTINESNDNDECKSNSNQNQPPKKENGINIIITQYCTSLFRLLSMPQSEHGYGSIPRGPKIYSTAEQWNTFINTIATGNSYNNKQGVLNSLLLPRYDINWDEEFAVIIASHHGSPPQSIQLKTDEYEINKENNSLIVVVETDNGRTDTPKCCAMAYYAFCIVVNKLRGFEKIGVKSRIIETHVPQCTSTLPTDDLPTISRKVRQFYANLTPNDYDRKVYESISYEDINKEAPNKSYNDPFGNLM